VDEENLPRAAVRSELMVAGTFYYFLLFWTVFDVVCGWRALAEVGMKRRGKSEWLSGLGSQVIDTQGDEKVRKGESLLRHHPFKNQ